MTASAVEGKDEKEGAMPTYEFVCGNCRKKFSVTMTFSERDKGRIVCPKCKSPKVEQQFSTVFTKTSRKS